MSKELSKIQKIIDSSFLDLLDMNDWGQEEKEEYVGKILATIETRILGRILGELGEDGKKEFEMLMEKNKNEAWNFLIAKIPNFEEIAVYETAKLKIELVK